jgi:hypothetical protein
MRQPAASNRWKDDILYFLVGVGSLIPANFFVQRLASKFAVNNFLSAALTRGRAQLQQECPRDPMCTLARESHREPLDVKFLGLEAGTF